MAQTVILILGIFFNIALWIFLFMHFKKMFSSEALLKDIRREVEKLVIEIDRTADQDITIIEARIKALRKLIDEADTKIMLSKNAEKSRLREQKVFNDIENIHGKETLDTKAFYTDTEKAIDTTDDDVKVDIDFESYKIPMDMQGEASEESTSNFTEQASFSSDEVKIPKISNSTKNEKPLKTKVLELYKSGFTTDIISQNLDISVREIELIISMYG